MSVEYTGANHIKFVSGNQFITVSDQLNRRIDANDRQIDDMKQKLDSHGVRISSLDRTVDTDHFLYFDSLFTRARLPQDIFEFTIFVAPNGEVFWAEIKPRLVEEFGIATYFTEDQFIKLMQCEYKLEHSGEYDCRWQMIFASRNNRKWWTKSAYTMYNILPVEGSSVGESSYYYNLNPEECDYPLFPFDKPGYTDKEIEKICEKLFTNESYQRYSNKSGFLVYFTTLKDGGYIESIIENDYCKLGSKSCYYFN